MRWSRIFPDARWRCSGPTIGMTASGSASGEARGGGGRRCGRLRHREGLSRRRRIRGLHAPWHADRKIRPALAWRRRQREDKGCAARGRGPIGRKGLGDGATRPDLFPYKFPQLKGTIFIDSVAVRAVFWKIDVTRVHEEHAITRGNLLHVGMPVQKGGAARDRRHILRPEQVAMRAEQQARLGLLRRAAAEPSAGTASITIA